MNDRRRRVNMLSEPNLELEPCNVASVRHQNLGLVRRLFNSEMNIKHVYDWIDSLATYPEYFHLVDFQNRIAQEDDKIDTIKFVLKMTETSAELAEVVRTRKINQMQLQ